MWKISPGSEILLRQWNDEWVIYHADSGATYLLTQLGGCILQSLLEGRESMEALSTQVSSCFKDDTPPKEQLGEVILKTIHQFMRLHLVVASST